MFIQLSETKTLQIWKDHLGVQIKLLEDIEKGHIKVSDHVFVVVSKEGKLLIEK